MMQNIQNLIESAWDQRASLKPDQAPDNLRQAVETVIAGLDDGSLRVAEKIDGQWQTHQWVKKAVLLSFRLTDNRVMGQSPQLYYDKVPLKFQDYSPEDFQRGGFRVVPTATVRRGAYIAPDVVLLPSYVNIGARVGEGSMVDTWATVGSCA